MWEASEDDFKKIESWGLKEDPFAAITDFSQLRTEHRWLNPEQNDVYDRYVASRNEYIKNADFDKYYREAEKPIDRRRWEYLMNRKAWFIMPVGWDRIARSGGKVIDLGCGDGDTVQRLIDFIEDFWKKNEINDVTVEIVGVDLNHSRIRNAENHVACENPRIKFSFQQGDAIGAPLPFADKNFDFSLCCGVFEILNDDQFNAFLREMTRITSKGLYIEDLFERFPGGFPRDSLGKSLLENSFLVKERHVILSEPFSTTELQDPKKLWPVLLDQNLWAESTS